MQDLATIRTKDLVENTTIIFSISLIRQKPSQRVQAILNRFCLNESYAGQWRITCCLSSIWFGQNGPRGCSRGWPT